MGTNAAVTAAHPLLLLLRHILFLPLPPPPSSILPPPPSPLLLLPLRAFYVACRRRLVVLFFFRCDCGSSASPAVGALDVPVLLLLPPRSSWRPPSNGTDCLPAGPPHPSVDCRGGHHRGTLFKQHFRVGVSLAIVLTNRIFL